MSRLLVVHHSPTDTLRKLTDAALDGARDPAIEGVEVIERPALDATVEDVLDADGYLLGTSANLGYISGALKHFFDSVYNDVRDPTAKRPFAYWIRGGYDTTGAERAMESITTGLQWSLAAQPLVFTGGIEPHLDEATELGGTLAALLME
ncbi:flavodoxin [Aeromicrobium sp. PE09-221]|uniref:flavodoxin family protein n=1 Tax=Aeromicrobium sp. PE09-221 TaxID=1898043 RepID=UPI000B3ECD7B|nr:flavodoxin family protein [Aeromicrobium sp. PE09-221]OUZ07250.1 flavodoxin [Aeromicrobium sp. PE09-221]